MHVIEIFLPVRRNYGSLQPRGVLGDIRAELVEKFGGLTAYSRAPADGFWQSEEGQVEQDAIVVIEVMTEETDRQWWRDFRARLEKLLEQQAVLIRSSAVERL